jgi:hypothetical protein
LSEHKLYSGDIALGSGGGSGGGAPDNAQYLTLVDNGTLTVERVFTVGNGLDAVNNGAGNTYVVSVDETELDIALIGGDLDDITGASNQIDVDAGGADCIIGGDVVLSLSSTLVAPGTLSVTGNTTLNSAVLIEGDVGINFNPVGEADCDLLTVDVIGAPTLSWDESADVFAMTHGLGVTGDVDLTTGDLTLDVGDVATTDGSIISGLNITALVDIKTTSGNLIATAGNVQIDDGQALITQNSLTGAVPVAVLEQKDLDYSFLDFKGTIGGTASSNINTLTTSGSTTHHIKLSLNDTTDVWVAVSSTNPS